MDIFLDKQHLKKKINSVMTRNLFSYKNLFPFQFSQKHSDAMIISESILFATG